MAIRTADGTVKLTGRGGIPQTQWRGEDGVPVLEFTCDECGRSPRRREDKLVPQLVRLATAQGVTGIDKVTLDISVLDEPADTLKGSSARAGRARPTA
jgi:hypothetical protein